MKNASDKGSGRKSRNALPSKSYSQRKPVRNTSRNTSAKSTRALPGKRRIPAARGARKIGIPQRGWLRVIAGWSLTCLLWGILIGGVVIGYFAYTLPDISNIDVIEKRPSMTLQTAGKARYATYGDLYGRMLRPEQIPDVMKEAVLATEDNQFYHHFGVNPVSVARAFWRNYQAGRIVEGGSTITQQLAKNLFLTPDRNFQRKIREILLAFWLEANYSKDEILALYLNRMYMGSGTYGIDAASNKYFSKPAEQLSVAEAAMLAGLLKGPSYYAPTVSLERAQQRSTLVIRRMQDEGYLTPAEADKLVRNPAKLQYTGSGFRNVRYFSDWVAEEVRSYIGRTEQDIVVTTTLNLDMQKSAESALEAQLSKNAVKFNVDQGALVAMTPDGAVRAMVGGRSYAESSFNRAALAKRQPGSVFKTIIYASGFENGRTPEDIFIDGPISINGWEPLNYSRQFGGAMTLRDAFTRSVNSVAIQLTEDIGRNKVMDMAARLGLSGPISGHPSMSLGTSEVTLLEMSSAYAVIANGGSGVLPYGVLEVRTKGGDVLYQRHSSGLGRVLSGRTVNEMRDIMTNVITTGTGRAANPGFVAAGKTGTTQSYRDAWFIGFTPTLVAGVWFGNDDGSATRNVTGSNLPAQTWRNFMIRAVANEQRVAFDSEAEKPRADPNSIWQRIVKTFSGGNTSKQPPTRRQNVPAYPTGGDQPRP